MRGHAVAPAYRGAIDMPCADCGAEVGVPCTRTDDKGAVWVRKVPCLARLQPLNVEIVFEDSTPIDFAEPRRRQDELW